MILPSFVHDFSNASIDRVDVGPRRELTLSIALLVWDGTKGRSSDAVRVRFGGIENFTEASEFFAEGPHETSELAWLRYAAGRRSKPGRLFFELAFERIDARLVIQCSSLQGDGLLR